MERVTIIGGGGHAKVLIDCIEQENKYEIAAILDDNPDLHQILNYQIRRRQEFESLPKTHLIIGIGNCQIRKKIAEEFPGDYITTIHPTAIVSRYAKIGKGSHIFAGAIINAGAVIGNHVIINTGAVIEHDCTIEDWVHVSPNCALGGSVTVKQGTHLGIGSTVIQCLSIGKNVTVGAGAVVISDIPDHCTAVGIPAKPIKYHDPH